MNIGWNVNTKESQHSSSGGSWYFFVKASRTEAWYKLQTHGASKLPMPKQKLPKAVTTSATQYAANHCSKQPLVSHKPMEPIFLEISAVAQVLHKQVYKHKP